MTNHIEDLISAYIDNELKEQERFMVETHLEKCPDCRSILEDLVNIQSQLKAVFYSVEIPDHLDEKVMNAINFGPEPNTYRSQQKFWFIIPLISAFSLLALLIISLGIFLFKPVSILFGVMFNVIFALGNIMSSEPYLVGGSVLFSLFLIIASSITLRRLLITKTV